MIKPGAPANLHGATACLPAVALVEAAAAVGFVVDGWEAVTPGIEICG
jgi:hypothetical protein